MGLPTAAANGNGDTIQPLIEQDDANNISSSGLSMQGVALASATLTVILLGVGLVSATALVPALVILFLSSNDSKLGTCPLIVVTQLVHLSLLGRTLCTWPSTAHCSYRFVASCCPLSCLLRALKACEKKRPPCIWKPSILISLPVTKMTLLLL